MNDHGIVLRPTIQQLIDALDQADPQVERGKTVPAAEIHPMLHDAVTRLERNVAS